MISISFLVLLNSMEGNFVCIFHFHGISLNFQCHGLFFIFFSQFSKARDKQWQMKCASFSCKWNGETEIWNAIVAFYIKTKEGPETGDAVPWYIHDWFFTLSLSLSLSLFPLIPLLRLLQQQQVMWHTWHHPHSFATPALILLLLVIIIMQICSIVFLFSFH